MSLLPNMSRRQFVRTLSAGFAALATPGSASAQTPPTTSAITAIQHDGAILHTGRVDAAPDSDVVEFMVDAALLAHFGAGDVADAWSHTVSPDDRVVVKLDTAGAPAMASHEAVVYAVVRGLLAAGVPARNICVFDRLRSHLARAHFRVGDDVLGAPIAFGLTHGYQDEATSPAGSPVHLAAVLDWATAVVSIPVLKDDAHCGVGGALASMGYGFVEEADALRSEVGAASLAPLCAHPSVRGKLRLVVMDGLRLLYDGGPEDGPAKVVHNTLYVSHDPLAIDTLALDRIDEARRQHEMRALGRDGRAMDWLVRAEELGVGIHDRARIALSSHRFS